MERAIIEGGPHDGQLVNVQPEIQGFYLEYKGVEFMYVRTHRRDSHGLTIFELGEEELYRGSTFSPFCHE